MVDDDEDVRDSVAAILGTVGYTVMAAADVDEAPRLLTSTRFDTMVLDLKMPRLDDGDRDRVGDAIVAYLRKPAPPQRLIDAVDGAVRIGRG